jgi:hypothetical protein
MRGTFFRLLRVSDPHSARYHQDEGENAKP